VRLQFLGSGDAFGSGGRFNTCFHLTKRTIVTHMSPELLGRRCEIALEAAHDGLVVEF